MVLDSVVTLAQSDPLRFLIWSFVVGVVWVFLDKGQLESFNFGGRRIAVPIVVIFGGAVNYVLQTQGFEGLVGNIASSIVTGVGILLVAAFFARREGMI